MKVGVAVCERMILNGGSCLNETQKYYERKAREKGTGDFKWPDNVPIFLCDNCAKDRVPLGTIKKQIR